MSLLTSRSSLISVLFAGYLAALSAPAFSQFAAPASQPATAIDPNKIRFSPILHEELPPAMLKRIKAITDTFESIDGISYTQAVDLYKRDRDPEANLVIWDEMLKAYKSFCRFRCKTDVERMDVYRVLLLRSMFSEDEAVRQAKPRVLSPVETRAAMKYYHLAPKPIDLVPAK
ncbi:hypothetical protein [Undibacterium terreum]|uniref:Uncharacterized protein n=1 Tax=Undibacterium terreum TaxID=1224302 RepID=A0A916XEW8_9BURK|nr:hypothetical protein [Undibacterium terreum]GGC67059.1 hypothetical protein GCM10011396_12540 [Undibacterium terreum]